MQWMIMRVDEGLPRIPGPAGGKIKWSERLDSNQRPLTPQISALPGCATLRHGGRL